MKLRLSGTQDKCAAAGEVLAAGFVVREVSGFYPNRGASVLGTITAPREVLGALAGHFRVTGGAW